MNKIIAHLIYPVDFKLDDKDIELNEFEFDVLTKCKKIGSEGKYFEIVEMMLEESETGISVTIVLN